MPDLLVEGDGSLLAEGGLEYLGVEGGALIYPGGGIASQAIGVDAIAGNYLPAVVIPAPEPPVFPKRLYTVDLCVAWRRVAEAPVAIFDGVIRDLARGEWRLSGAVAGLVFQPGYTLADVDTVRVVCDADIVYPGFVAPVATGVGGLDIVAGPDGEQFTLTGADGWDALASRVAYPTPATGPPWADSHDIRTGPASTAASGYVLANAGSAATPDRVIPGLNVIDEAVGYAGDWSARLQPLDQLVARVCRDGGITCRIGVDFAGAITVTLRNPNDRSNTIVFSDQGDLTNIQHVRVPPAATFVIAGGQGQLTSRTFAYSGAATGAARREVFTDQSSLSTVTEVQQSAATTLAGHEATLTVRAELTDAATAGRRYLRDYEIGDTVAVEIGDRRYPCKIEALTVHVSPDRQVIKPLLGDASPNMVTGMIRDIAGLAARFDNTIS